ncbi:MAG: hypothetical protein ACOYJ2_07540, partial [Rickettsiales bacterium]
FMQQVIRANDPVMAQGIAPYVAGGAKGDLFDLPTDRFNPSAISGWNLSHAMDDPTTRTPLATYLLHRLTMQLDGKPTIIVLDEGFLLMDSPIFGTKAKEWLEFLTKRNAMVLLLTGKPEESANLAHSPTIMRAMTTQFYLPDTDPMPQYMDRFGLNESEYYALPQLSSIERQVLLKRADGNHVLAAKLDGLGVLCDTLSGRLTAGASNPAELLAELMNPRKEPA